MGEGFVLDFFCNLIKAAKYITRIIDLSINFYARNKSASCDPMTDNIHIFL
jgi:hypothetical protein